MDHLKYIDLSLSRIRDFMSKLGNLQNKIPNVIHVAGTNGKGSTTAFMRYILEEHGFTTSCYISPHLVKYNERFRIKGQLITDDYLEDIKARLQKIDGFSNLTVFEASTVIGFIAFYESQTDYCILETGLGGRLDATNIIDSPIISVITTIDYDHQNFLGNTLDKIAYEKAGIIKKNVPVISDYQTPEVSKVLRKQAKKMNSPIILGGKDYSIQNKTLFINDKVIALTDIGLLGEHQINNAALAVSALMHINNLQLDYDKILQGLKITNWFGRLQKVDTLYGIKFKDDIYLDGAHNVSGGKVLKNFIEGYITKNPNVSVHIIFGMLLKKDLEGFLDLFTYLPITLYPINYKDLGMREAEDIKTIAEQKNINTKSYNDIKSTLISIQKTYDKKLIIICGSLYMLGEIMKENNIFPD
jgi:dihydrofolate synthase/folylpolyglutamate synthase